VNISRVKTYSESDTINAGANFGKLLKKGDIVGLYGGLGSGKTVFTKGIAKALGIEECITSPTFTIVKEYYGKIPLYHFDAYRIGNAADMLDTGILDYLDGSGVVVVEWADLTDNILPSSVIRVNLLKYPGDNDNIRIIEMPVKLEGEDAVDESPGC